MLPQVTDEYHIHYSSFKTGDRIIFKTVNPVTHPLPDPGLLFARALLAKISLPVEIDISINKAVWDENYFYHDYFGNDSSNVADNQNDEDLWVTVEDIATDTEVCMN